MTAVNYLWNPLNDNIVEEFDDLGNTIAEYTTESELFGNLLSQYRDSQESFFHFDGVGSTVAITNAGGQVTDTRSYSAFGETTEQSGNMVLPFQYVGMKEYYQDIETDTYDIRRRLYQRLLGRWLTTDPTGLSRVFSQYVYVDCNPLRWIDCSGESIQPTPRRPRDLPSFPVYAGLKYSCFSGVAVCGGHCGCTALGTHTGLLLALEAALLSCCEWSCTCGYLAPLEQPRALEDCIEIAIRFAGFFWGDVTCNCT